MRRLNQQGGFSLVEAMVALAITALTVTVGMYLLGRQSEVSRRVRAHLEATRAIETTLEELRAGVRPLESGPVEMPEIPAGPEENEALGVWIDVEPRAELPGLSEVSMEARYVLGERTLQREIRTMVWRPQ